MNTPTKPSFFTFENENETPKTPLKTPPKTPIKTSPKTPSFFMKSAEQRKKAELETIEELDSEARKIRNETNEEGKKLNFQEIEDYELQEGEKRTYIEPRSAQDPKFLEVLSNLQEWVNEMLNDEDRIRVTSMADDFFDGVVFKRIVEKLTNTEIKLPLDENVQAKERQKKNLTAVLDKIGDILRLTPDLAP